MTPKFLFFASEYMLVLLTEKMGNHIREHSYREKETTLGIFKHKEIYYRELSAYKNIGRAEETQVSGDAW